MIAARKGTEPGLQTHSGLLFGTAECALLGVKLRSLESALFSYAAGQDENSMAAKGNGKVPSWLPHAVTALKDVLLPELKEHTGLLRQQGDALIQIVGVLREHSTVLHEHSSTLQEHSALLREHSAILREQSTNLQEQAVILREHSAILREHSTSLQEHSALLREQGERTARLEGRVDGLERTTQQGFGLLSDRMAGLERSIDRLTAEIRVSLELRDRVARIEEKIGMSR
jgi:hypothetical protein